MCSRGGRSGCHYSTLHENKKTMKVPVSQVELDLALNADLTTILQADGVRPLGEYVTVEDAQLLSIDISQEVMENDSVEF